MASPPPTRTPPKARLSKALFSPNTESPLTIKVSKQVVTSPSILCTDGNRKNALVDLGETIPQVPVDFFLGNDGILPPLRDDIDRELIVQSLIDNDTILNGRWAAFDKDPCTSSAHEDVVFSDIENIAKAILEASGKKTSRTLDFECNPNTAPESSTRNNNTRPDCYGILANRDGDTRKPRWVDIAIPGEFKKKRRVSEENDNWTKVLWSMNHIMREDARRRFVFGFTIENTVMRLWFACRSEVLVSFAFDFIQKPKYVVAFFLRMMFAKEHELGWDPTMTRVSPRDCTDGVQYHIQCEGSTYRTTRLISNVGAEALRGRGTRVWEVRELNADGEENPTPLVLKDSWVDAERKREGKIMDELSKAAEANGKKKAFDLYFLKVKTFADVHIDGQPDHTHTLIRRGRTVEKNSEKPLKVKAEPPTRRKLQSNLMPAGAATLPMKLSKDSLEYEEKVHHRIVFSDVGITVGEVDTLSQAFACLSDVTTALCLMHECGWVHRDISLGNILLVDGVAKIADLEYAKKDDDFLRHGVRTGTPFFMSTEVECHRYLHRDLVPEAKEIGGEKVDFDAQIAKSNNRWKTNPVNPEGSIGVESQSTGVIVGPTVPPKRRTVVRFPRRRVFRHNPLHDLESVLWVCIWITVCSAFIKNDPQITDEEWSEYLKRHSVFAEQLFCDLGFRRSAMSSSPEFLDGFQDLIPDIAWVGAQLDEIKLKLLTRYKEAERRLDDPDYQIEFRTVAGDLHSDMVKLFDATADELHGDDMKIDVQAQMQKRKHMQETFITAPPSERISSEAPSDHGDRPRKAQKRHSGEIASSASAVSLDRSSKIVRARKKTL